MTTIVAYLNDLAFKLNRGEDWTEPFDRLMECLSLLNEIDKSAATYSTVAFKSLPHKAVNANNDKIIDFLNKDKERKTKFVSVLKRATTDYNLIDWDAGYYIGEARVTGSAASDAYENNTSGNVSVLLNLCTGFPVPNVAVEKRGHGLQDIASYNLKDGLRNFLTSQNLLVERIRFYDKKSNYRPSEYETILADKTLFEPTKFGNRGIRLYRRLDEPDQLWCLDRGHRGTSIHLEVFSESSCKQIHVSEHDKINFFRELTEKEKNRELDMKPL